MVTATETVSLCFWFTLWAGFKCNILIVVSTAAYVWLVRGMIIEMLPVPEKLVKYVVIVYMCVSVCKRAREREKSRKS